ncbi:MAG TPA: arsenate reductase (glutaredoxin) [Cytophagaceae bacterium]|jgi:arsenate reductase|nr:arsenate reductase (glutaredoxin) [Cytophagaceae bacterium]
MSDSIIIYHNPRCQKSRTALEELEDNGTEVKIVEYLKTAPTGKELKVLCEQLNLKPKDLVRKSEPLYKEQYQGQVLSDAQWLKVLSEHPILIQRPIVVKGNKAAIAREEGVLRQFLK